MIILDQTCTYSYHIARQLRTKTYCKYQAGLLATSMMFKYEFFKYADRARLTVKSSQDWITSQNSSTQLVASNSHLVDRVLASSAEYYAFTEVKAIDALASDETSNFTYLT